MNIATNTVLHIEKLTQVTAILAKEITINKNNCKCLRINVSSLKQSLVLAEFKKTNLQTIL